MLLRTSFVAATLLLWWNKGGDAKLYEDGACPIFSLLPFSTSR